MRKILLGTCALVLLGCSRSAPVSDPSATAATTGTVTIEIVTNTGTQTIEIPDVAAGTSLEDVMRSIEAVSIKIQGSGTTAFVDRIGDQGTNTTDGWTFKVDGEFANQGIGSTTLTPPNTVTWSFGDFEEAE